MDDAGGDGVDFRNVLGPKLDSLSAVEQAFAQQAGALLASRMERSPTLKKWGGWEAAQKNFGLPVNFLPASQE